ncbi:uncharacterized protein FOMMEDRAFT_159764 [Fomitiporia mediterranea MF3/22]|uniref:uncharacterized protein n=1 Tax=Fomitiporia mediterranea (strain MF3/22) TaxID=694068 RepID=UPI0004409CC5|nr:uncharacterized protein FOMMEDRAFT_159764 [Fomitiporia mediterranea MF3/22]EJD00123.1 hypothetical protein FOMMEDRAFT_159764 [Fomitiporia mediterranea MF3/22]
MDVFRMHMALVSPEMSASSIGMGSDQPPRGPIPPVGQSACYSCSQASMASLHWQR